MSSDPKKKTDNEQKPLPSNPQSDTSGSKPEAPSIGGMGGMIGEGRADEGSRGGMKGEQ